MPMFDAIALLAGAVAALAAGAALSPAIRWKLTTLPFWMAALLAAAATSALSQFVVERGHGGTGMCGGTAGPSPSGSSG